MAENGEIPLTGDPRVDLALQRIRGKFRDLEDAMIVLAHLEKNMAEQIRRHAEHIAFMEADDRRHREKMAEIEDKFNFIIDRDMRREGEPESQRS